MDVNFLKEAFTWRGFKLVITTVVALGAVFFLAAFVTDKSGGEIISKRVNIAVRAIGHELLLRAGDSTSIVPPVIEKSKGVFLLQFQNEFVFQPDTLVAIVQRILAKTELSQYTVTVQECHRPVIVYGFEINPPNNSIKPCRGRSQPKACYNIEVAFADFPHQNNQNAAIVMMGGAILSVFVILFISKNLGPKKLLPETQQNFSTQNVKTAFVTIGKSIFDTTLQSLRMGEEAIPLTEKESKILTLLNKNFGGLTRRDDLVQEVWTDEGVITGRSLDMFISKLRKKLSGDPDLRITNVHGKGYRLEVLNNSIV